MTAPLEQLSDTTRSEIEILAHRFSDDEKPLSVLLSGPQALGVDRKQDKYYFVLINDDPEGVIEHRFLRSYAEIQREIEVGLFPLKLIEELDSNGYWDIVTLRATEALSISIPLIDPAGHGKKAVEVAAKLLPHKRFISGHIHKIKATFDDAVSLYAKGSYAGSVIVAREALRLGIETLLKLRGIEHTPTDEELKQLLGSDLYESLLRAAGIKDASKEEVAKHIDRLSEISHNILKELGIDPSMLE